MPRDKKQRNAKSDQEANACLEDNLPSQFPDQVFEMNRDENSDSEGAGEGDEKDYFEEEEHEGCPREPSNRATALSRTVLAQVILRFLYLSG